ncbi:MAG TPA: cytochrome c3 family protein [Verrucomicrobiae bacterium]|nr:cytochrome c3 family protein [Verrucomicrobiae bacterium]
MKTQRLLAALIILLGCGACLGKDTCFECHRVMEGTSLKFVNDIHFTNSISCANCHGGDPTETDQNISMNASRGFKVRVTHQGVPEFCGNCHSDTNFMSKYDPQLPVDQLAKYKEGVHGRSLAAGNRRAAECVDCHGVHNIRAVDDPLASVSPRNVARTCAKCHASTAEAFAKSRHARVFTTQRLRGCIVCHAPHDTQPATTAMLTGPNSVCARCHRPGSPPIQLAEQMAQVLSKLEAAGPGSKAALDRARVAVHSLSLEAVRQAAEPPPAGSDDN